jgi:hypothetical protein
VHLAGQGGDDALCVDQGRVAQVVQAVAAEDLGARLEPDGLAELGAVLWEAGSSVGSAGCDVASDMYCALQHITHGTHGELWMRWITQRRAMNQNTSTSRQGGGAAHAGQQLWGDAAEGAQHGPPCVDQLCKSYTHLHSVSAHAMPLLTTVYRAWSPLCAEPAAASTRRLLGNSSRAAHRSPGSGRRSRGRPTGRRCPSRSLPGTHRSGSRGWSPPTGGLRIGRGSGCR